MHCAEVLTAHGGISTRLDAFVMVLRQSRSKGGASRAHSMTAKAIDKRTICGCLPSWTESFVASISAPQSLVS